MSWLKKVFGGTAPAELSEAGRAAVAGGHASAKATKYIPRAERVALQSDHRIAISLAGDPQPVEIHNISLSGIAYRPSESTVGARVQLRVEVAGRGFDIAAEVMRVSGDIAGVKLVDPSFDLSSALSQYLQAEILGLRVVAVDPKYLNAAERGQAHWFEGEKKSGLYYVEEAGRLHHFTLSFLGNVVEWAEGQTPRFGQTRNDPSARAYTVGSAVDWEMSWPEGMLTLAQRFVRTIQKLNPGHAEQVLAQIAKIPSAK